MAKTIQLGDQIIGENKKPFIVAEAGVNYYEVGEKLGLSPLEAAKKIIKKAVKAGADAIKFQTYKAEKIAVKDSLTYWNEDSTQREFFKKYDKFGASEYRELAKYAEENSITFMSSAFDEEAVDFLDNLMPVFKIASADITNIPLLKYTAKKGKPIFLSTGASTLGEIETALSHIRDEGVEEIVLLHCTLSYPTKYKNANLSMIDYLAKVFPRNLIGYSDHTLPDPAMVVLTTAVLLGARVIEKHFTLDKSLPGNDHYHAMDPVDLKRFVKNISLLEQIIGQEIKQPIKEELISRNYARRSLVTKVDIPKGTVITKDMLTQKRPGVGISPIMIDIVVGRKTKEDIKADSLVLWKHI